MSIDSITQAAAAQGTANASISKLSDDIDDFLLILTTQLQNQDPLSPLESNEFTNQLVQFANVEQSINQSKKLENLITLQRRTEMSEAVSLVGKRVKYDYNEFKITPEDTNGVDLEYTLPEEATAAALYVFDQEGNPVYLKQLENFSGTHTVRWDAVGPGGQKYLDGQFHFEVLATDLDGNPMEDINYSASGRITGVEYGANETTLKFGDLSIGHGKLEEVYDAPLVYYGGNNGNGSTDNTDSADSTDGDGATNTDGNSDTASDESGEASNDNQNPDEASS